MNLRNGTDPTHEQIAHLKVPTMNSTQLRFLSRRHSRSRWRLGKHINIWSPERFFDNCGGASAACTFASAQSSHGVAIPRATLLALHACFRPGDCMPHQRCSLFVDVRMVHTSRWCMFYASSDRWYSSVAMPSSR